MQVIENKALLFKTRNPEKYNLIPKHKIVDEKNGIYEIAVYFGLDETRVLKNLGVKNVPSPIEYRYNWPGRFDPFKHQKETAAFLTMNRRAFVFSEPGTGKTLSSLWAADYLMKIGAVRRCLILCPLSIMTSAWMQDLNNSIIHRSCIVAHHSQAARRIEMIKNDYEFVIINYEGLNLVAEDINKDGRFDLIIVDEANAYKNVSAKRFKSLTSIIKPETHLWLMTGTPAAQSPLDAYGLARLVNPNNTPKTYKRWQDQVIYQVIRFKYAAKPTAGADVHDLLQPAIRFTKAQCLDLPPVMTVTREVPLTAQQDKYYKLLKKKMTMYAAGETITAVNAAAGVNKLLQISAGAAYTDNQEVIEFDCAPRLNVLLEVLEETNLKVLVFAPYRHSIDTISRFLEKNNVDCAQIHGDVTPTRRTAIFKQFQTEDSPRVLVIQPQAASHGVTLTAADTVVFWGPVMSVETYLQCCARTDRVGQNSDKVTIVHIQGSDLEKKMFKLLAGRVDEHIGLVKLYEEEVLNG